MSPTDTPDAGEMLRALRIDRGPDRPKRRRWPWIVGGLVLVLVVAFLLLGRRPLEVETAVARSAKDDGPVSVLDASGYVTARRIATVSSKITGKVEEVLIEEGMQVEEGQVLARLDATDARAQLELAKSQLAANQAALGEARAQLTLAELNVANTVIRAPFAGVIVAKAAQPGEMISPVSAGGGFTRTGIGTLVDMASLEVQVDVNEAYIGRVKPEQPVEAVLNAYADWRIPGSVIAIIPTADRSKATVKVRIALGLRDPRIVPDMGVRVSFLDENAAAESGGGVWVPSRAVVGEGKDAAVFVLQDGSVDKVSVTLGDTRDAERRVLKGLAAGATVVVSPPRDLQPGRKVVVKPDA